MNDGKAAAVNNNGSSSDNKDITGTDTLVFAAESVSMPVVKATSWGASAVALKARKLSNGEITPSDKPVSEPVDAKCNVKTLVTTIVTSANSASDMDVKGVMFELYKCIAAKKIGASILLFLSNAANVLDILSSNNSEDKLIKCLKQTQIDGTCSSKIYDKWRTLLQEEQFKVHSPNSL